MGDINPIDILIYILNFCITLTILYILLYKPVSKFMEDRKDRIAKALKEAEQMQQEAKDALQEAKDELAGTREKNRQLSHEAIDNAMQDAENILDNAQEQASETITKAREQIEAERQASLERSYTEIVSFTGILTSRILAREVTIEDNREIVERFFGEKIEQEKSASDSQTHDEAPNAAPEKEEKQI